MSRLTSPLLPFLLVLPLSACLENEEEIEIGADGSVAVTVTARGKVGDLADGFPVPLDGAWQPVADGADLWLREVGPATGGAWAQDRVDELDWKALGVDPEHLELSARARFGTVEDWPRYFAPANEPYREAYSERSANLRIERRGPYTVYSFERTFHARKSAGYDLFSTLFESTADWPEDLAERLDENQPLSPEDWRFLARELQGVFARIYRNFAADALEVEDDGAYSRATAARIVDEVSARIADLVTEERVMNMLAEMHALEEQEEEELSTPLLQLEQDARDLLRVSIEEELSTLSLPDPVVFTVLGRVEFGLTAADHSADLSGEKFVVSVKMPGTILSGNYGSVDDVDSARWEFEADAFIDRDHVLRVVSIVD